MNKTELKKLNKLVNEISNLPDEERPARLMEIKKANPYIDLRLENYRNRFFELKGRYPEQNETPEKLGGTMK